MLNNKCTQQLFTIQAEESNSTDWVKIHKKRADDLFFEHGAVLLRGFNNYSTRDFYTFCHALSPSLLNYDYQSTPRTNLGKSIYTATEYPADREIPLHNENSYTNHWPSTVIFCCQLPAAKGGQTPIANSAEILEQLPADIIEEFKQKRCRYTRYFYPGIDLSWQTVFQTENRVEVGTYCQKNKITYHWLDEPSGPELMTVQDCDAIIQHPKKSIACWFNQANLFHPNSLQDADKKILSQIIKDDRWPRNVSFADGSNIPDHYIKTINATYKDMAIYFDWRLGDILILDNILYAHGRTCFEGPRKIIVGMY